MVVGAGPAGACLALMLARQGVNVTLVEASTRLERQFRGEALMPQGLAALDAMGLTRLLERIPHRPLAGWRFLLDGQELFEVPEPLEGPTGRPCTLVSQPALLTALLQELSGHPQARLVLGQRVVGLIREEQRITGVRLADGEELQALLVVACDGRHSSLRQQAGLSLEQAPGAIELLWFRLPAAAGDLDPVEGAFLTSVGEQGIFSAFTSAGGDLQLGWVLEPQDRSGRRSDWLSRMALQSPPALAQRLRQAQERPPEPVRLQVAVGMAPRWWCPGLLLLGDAAHPMSPVRAQGINLALRDAWVAAQLLGEAFRQPAAASSHQLEAVLEQIEALRRPEVATLQRLQALETRRGTLLRQQGLLRRGLIAAAPWLAPALASHWRHSQQILRHGTTNLVPAVLQPQ